MISVCLLFFSVFLHDVSLLVLCFHLQFCICLISYKNKVYVCITYWRTLVFLIVSFKKFRYIQSVQMWSHIQLIIINVLEYCLKWHRLLRDRCKAAWVLCWLVDAMKTVSKGQKEWMAHRKTRIFWPGFVLFLYFL